MRAYSHLDDLPQSIRRNLMSTSVAPCIVLTNAGAAEPRRVQVLQMDAHGFVRPRLTFDIDIFDTGQPLFIELDGEVP